MKLQKLILLVLGWQCAIHADPLDQLAQAFDSFVFKISPQQKQFIEDIAKVDAGFAKRLSIHAPLIDFLIKNQKSDKYKATSDLFKGNTADHVKIRELLDEDAIKKLNSAAAVGDPVGDIADFISNAKIYIEKTDASKKIALNQMKQHFPFD